MNGLALPPARGDGACPSEGRAIFGLSLCAGAGGLDLGLHLALPGYRTVCYVERESFAAATLVGRMEDAALDCAPVWDDVKTFDGKAWRGIVDIVHGGYPCQPFSVAGKKLGDKDPRHLWPDIAKIVRTIKPPICFFENVGGHLRLGFEQVHDDLSKMGYRVKAGLFTAEEVGAPHRRERLFILAYRTGVFGQRGLTKRDLGWEPQGALGSERGSVVDAARARKRRETENLPETDERQNGSMPQFADGADCSLADAARAGARQHKLGSRDQFERSQQGMADAAIDGLQGERKSLESLHPTENSQRKADQSFDDGASFSVPIWPPTPADYDGWSYIPTSLKPAVCRMADGMANRMDRLRTCGNGVVPLAAAYAFCTLATQAIAED